jgi:hypothetical protein
MMTLVKGIDLAPFARVQWKTPESKREWEPVMKRAVQAYNAAELETVRRGWRRCTTMHFNPNTITEDIKRLKGLAYLPIRRVGVYQGFAHKHPPVEDGKPWNYYGVVGKTAQDAWDFVEANHSGDHKRLGDLLGYPSCCQEFFSTVWMAGFIDPVWQAAERTEGAEVNGANVRIHNSISFDGLRYIGVRMVPHLPCSFSCKGSQEMAEKWQGLEGMDTTLKLLSLPITWTCLNGVAVVVTPHFRITTNSNPCYPVHTVEMKP